MGKKSRRKKSNAPRQTHLPAACRKHAQDFNRESEREAFAMIDDMDRLPLREQKNHIRKALLEMGTNCESNDMDPTGDGDQSKIKTDHGRKLARDLYAIGGDISGHLRGESAISNFAMLCLIGSTKAAQQAITKITDHASKPWYGNHNFKSLLETRETSLRLSPLLLAVAAGKNISGQGDHAGIVSMLLKHGARPDAKDVLGKTVCHYGAGSMATLKTLDLVDMCINAAETSYMFGEDAELYGLKSKEMNGMKVVVGGFDPKSGRRLVYLPDKDKEILIKPENINITNRDSFSEHVPMLADVQDRVGGVSLHEVIMSDRTDVGAFLLEKHNTSINTVCCDGVTPLSMSSNGGVMMSTKVCSMVMDVAVKEGNARRKKEKQRWCARCEIGLGKKGFDCECGVVSYCSSKCQSKFWKNGHREECGKLTEMQTSGIRLDPSKNGKVHTATISHASGYLHEESYRKPNGVGVDEKFTIKVQVSGDTTPIAVYDETRACQFDIGCGQPGFKDIVTETRKEPTWDGRKTFMKASFDKSGACTVYPLTAKVRSNYTW